MPPFPRAEPFTDEYGSGEGFVEVVPVTTPAAGAEGILKIPGQYISRVISVTGQIVASGVAANRFMLVRWDDGNGTIYGRAVSDVAIVAGQTVAFSAFFGENVNAGALAQGIHFGMPALFMQPGHSLRIGAVAIDAGDALSRLVAYVERYPSKAHAQRRKRQHAATEAD